MGVFQNIRVLVAWYRGMALLGLDGEGRLRRRRVERLARSLLSENSRFARGPGLSLLAALESRRGNREDALALLDDAEEAFETAGMRAHVQAIRFRRAELSHAPTSPSEDALSSAGVANPARWVDSCVPRLVSPQRRR